MFGSNLSRMSALIVLSVTTLSIYFTSRVVFAAEVSNTGDAASQTRDLLIKKLTQVQLNLAPKDPSRVAVIQRLADLHAERARYASMKELENNCTVCNAGKDDRLKALKYYQDVLGQLSDAALPKVMTQIGHLYEMTGRESDAVATYEKILREQSSPEAVAEANLSLAEVYFKKRDFGKARGYYKAVANQPGAGSKGLASYRVAWCDFNEGKLQPAVDGLVTILKTPELLSRTAAAGVVQIDPQFQEEVSRDLATFLSRKTVTLADGELLYSLSPEPTKISNVAYLANEAERGGQIAASIALWRFAGDRQKRPETRMEGHIHLAGLEMTQKLLPEAIKDFETALSLWSQLGKNCESKGTSNDSGCVELHARLRKFVLDWNLKEKSSPSAELLAAYRSYIQVFGDEADMKIWAAKVASERKDYAGAVALYGDGAKAANTDQLESALLGAIEAAELAKDPALLNTAYDSYLALSKSRSKQLEVRYQKARLLYEKGDNEAAALALREIALTDKIKTQTGGSSGGSLAEAMQIRKQAADLSLDALVQLKDDARMEAWAGEYAKIFPKEAGAFAQISRKSVLTQAAETAAHPDTESLEKAWSTLTRFDLSAATAEEKTTYYKNKLILAEKLGRFSEARDCVEQLLRLPKLTPEDQQYALSRKAWLAELILDFDTALKTSEKITNTEFKGEAKWLKLAMFADLANKDPKPFYNEYLKDSKDVEKNALIAAQLVRDSKEPLKEIDRNKAILIKKPELLADLYMEVYGTTGSKDIVKRLTAPELAKTAGGQAVARSEFIDQVVALRNKFASQTLDGSNQKKMAVGLKTRVAMLDQAEKLASRAVETGDWTSQLVTLDLLARENDRFYQEILSLPVPAGLSAEDEQQYLTLLTQQAAPHKVRATDVSKKVSEFWGDEKALDQLATAAKDEKGGRRNLIVKQIDALASVADEAQKTRLQAMKEAEKKTVEALADTRAPSSTLRDLEGARQAVREKPMDRDRLQKLLTIEKQMRNGPMVAYLEERLGGLPNAQDATKDATQDAKGVL